MGRRLSDGEEMQNIRALGNFLRFWRESPEYPTENRGNDHIHFPIWVIYEWKKGGNHKKGFSSVFRVFVGSGPHDGTVDIDETAAIKITQYHLRFNPAFQKYEYDDGDHTLTISDTSEKMGQYVVLIAPALEQP
ncbi:hypothetical protein PH547_04160 [Rhizobium sp. CNPSo 3464]|uniref:hypothetical protein n=1 Tax=Rhizobium sp. CNPSo 3464 TaxID=3021406 RepID=UPI00254A32CE|nr:hypothetical protein [Rhizobium sp. CNPSo 3464]MDK4738059.1 hypothetical protein [Rhizobium sp. CNPSo 3464]